MKTVYNINWKAAPKEYKRFVRWHYLACPGDPLTADERFLKEGGVISDDNKRIKGKK
jgi:hypothetical protein